ncbi:MAG: hypothetical protein K6U80_09330, partial [Firmicutes bacterium]|nr:hypothetical protein [Bacillota bacterium]
PYYIADRSSQQRSLVFRRDQAYDFLRSQIPGRDGLVTIRIRELPRFEKSGHSTCLKDGSVLIEVIPGTFDSLIRMHLVPGTYLTDRRGQVIQSTIRSYDKCCRIKADTMEFIEATEAGLTSELCQDYIREIARITTYMADKLTEPRLEWTISDNELILFDLSFERQPLSLSEGNITILSRGDFQGSVFLMPDISILTSVCSLHTVSVVPDTAFYEARNSATVRDFLNELKRTGGKPVVVAKQPLTELALITDSVSAFIFEEGSLLCHLGIILREKGIPAVFLNRALSVLHNGTKVICLNGELQVL